MTEALLAGEELPPPQDGIELDALLERDRFTQRTFFCYLIGHPVGEAKSWGSRLNMTEVVEVMVRYAEQTIGKCLELGRVSDADQVLADLLCVSTNTDVTPQSVVEPIMRMVKAFLVRTDDDSIVTGWFRNRVGALFIAARNYDLDRLAVPILQLLATQHPQLFKGMALEPLIVDQ